MEELDIAAHDISRYGITAERPCTVERGPAGFPVPAQLHDIADQVFHARNALRSHLVGNDPLCADRSGDDEMPDPADQPPFIVQADDDTGPRHGCQEAIVAGREVIPGIENKQGLPEPV